MVKAPAPGDAKLPTPDWSLLCYMAADNDLSPYGMQDIQELTSHGRPENLHIGIELDTRGARGSIRYEVSPPDFAGRSHRMVVDRLPEQDSGDFKTLRNFLDWGIKRADAANRFVVVWGHGMGNAVAPDFQSMGGSIGIRELTDAFQQAGFRRASRSNGPNWSRRDEGRIAVLGFDACNMASLENAWSLRDTAQMIVASQEKVPAPGWPYQSLVDAEAVMASDRSRKKGGRSDVSRAQLDKIAKKILKSYIDTYEALGITAVTQSAIHTDGLSRIVTQTNELGRALADALGGRSAKKARAVRALCEDARLYVQGFHLGAYVDLGHLCSLLLEADVLPPHAAKLASQIKSAIEKGDAVQSMVGGKGRRTHAEVADATGLSIWFPAQRTRYMSERYRYATEHGEEFGGWRLFLDAYHR